MGELLKTDTRCRACGAPLSLEEMHFLGDANGTATCERCESAWLVAIEAWRRGGSAGGDDSDEVMPIRP